ncbi:MAG: GNAT family N-acetyltransferase [Pseudomonadota bacterium]
MSWQVRRATAEDAGTVATLMQQTFAEAYATLHSPADIEAYCQTHYREDVVRTALAEAGYCCLLAQAEEGAALGFAVLLDRRCDAHPELAAQELKQIYVRSSAFGTGLGQGLMVACCEVLREAGDSHLWLVVSDANHRAQRFYRKLGFAPAGAGPALVVGAETLSSEVLISDVNALLTRLASAAP